MCSIIGNIESLDSARQHRWTCRNPVAYGSRKGYHRRVSITLEVEDEVLSQLPLGPGERERHMSIELAARYYAKNWLTFGHAAAMARLDREAFACELAERGIPRDYGLTEAMEDIADARGE
ncbi:MAG: putative HTH domain antitoxin [Verrucomicrobiales bacterium]